MREQVIRKNLPAPLGEDLAEGISPPALVAPQPRVSIIIPAYKVASYIAETLDSVFEQTFTDYEVIVVNDGSPDTEDLERALEPYMERLVYLKQENRGAAAARNEGLRVAGGSLVAFLDADDLWLPDYLAEQLKFIESREYDLVYTDAEIFGDSVPGGHTYMETSPSTGEVTFQSLLSGRCNVITSGVVARRQLILDVGLFDEQLRNSQDFDLWLRLVRNGARLAYQRKVLLRYREHAGSLSGDELNRIKRELRVLEKVERTYELTSDERVEVAQVRVQLEAYWELVMGKQHLARGEFADARAAFRKANSFYRSWKLRVMDLLLRISPISAQRYYLRRARAINGK